jgi:hypothetical protein
LFGAVLAHRILLHGILGEGGHGGRQNTRKRETAENLLHSFLLEVNIELGRPAGLHLQAQMG